MFFVNRLAQQKNYLLATLSFLLIVLSGCTQIPNQQQSHAPSENNDDNAYDVFHQDSTVYFADKKSSISLRASFIQYTDAQTNKTTEKPQQQLEDGYKFQFRTILSGNNVINRASIIAGGKRIILIDTPLFIHPQRGLTVGLNDADTAHIRAYTDATLRFSFNDTSYLMSLRNDKLSEFIVLQ